MYYLLFTDYAGAALVEVVWVSIIMILEVPTGAIADIIGRKKTMLIAATGTGFAFLAFASVNSFATLMLSMVLFAVFDALHSGPFDAIVYDSLLALKREGEYKKFVANLKSIELIAMAGGAISGAYLFGINPRLPFIANAIVYFSSLIFVFFLTEPKIDSIKFSLKNYISQTREGFIQLFSQAEIRKIVIFILATGIIFTIGYELLSDILLIDFGLNENSLGFIYAVIFLLNAIFSRASSSLSKKYTAIWGVLIVFFLFGIAFLLTPWLSVGILVIITFCRNLFYSIYENLRIEILNQRIESNKRTTALSTFSMIIVGGYSVLALVSSSIFKIISPTDYAFLFGVVILIVAFVSIFLLRSLRKISSISSS